MNVHVLERIWEGDPGNVIIPRNIGGWRDGKAMSWKEGGGCTPQRAVEVLSPITDERILESKMDIYFTPLKYKGTRKKAEDVVELVSILWSDLDEVDPREIPLRPTIAWHSSSNRYQAIWILGSPIPAVEAAEFSRRIAYKYGADKGGWDLAQVLRVPGSYNFKRELPEKCELMWDDGEVYSIADLAIRLPKEEAVIEPEAPYTADYEESFIAGKKLSTRTMELIRTTEATVGERSDRLWELEKLLIEQGLPVLTVVNIVKATVWNKYASRKDGDSVLLKEVLKAETEHRDKVLSKPPVIVKSVEDDEPLELVADFVTRFMEQPTWLIKGFAQKASVGICSGEPKTMKSTLMLEMAISVASGSPFLGSHVVAEPAPVLYIQKENSEGDIQSRIKRIMTRRGVKGQNIPLFIKNNMRIDLREAEYKAWIRDKVEQYHIKLLILDPWYMMVGDIDENSSKEVGPLLTFLTEIRDDFQCAVMLVHHFNKGGSSRAGQRTRGSGVFHAWAENGIYTFLNGSPGHIKVQLEHRSYGPQPDLEIYFKTSNDDNPLYDTELEGTVIMRPPTIDKGEAGLCID